MTDEPNGEGLPPADDTLLAPNVIEGDPPGDDAAAALDTEAPAETPKPKKTAQERIDELTAKMRAEEREKDYWRTEAQRHQQAPAPKPEPKADDGPDPNDYTYGESDAAYIRAAATHEAKIAVRQELAQERAQSTLKSQLDNFEQLQATLYPDGEPAGITAIKRMDKLPVAVMETVLNSDIGPKLADHLGSNPAELRRLSGLSPALQAYEIGKLETRLTTAPKPAKTVTDAPDPAPQVRGAGGQFKVAADTNDFAAFDRAFP